MIHTDVIGPHAMLYTAHTLGLTCRCCLTTQEASASPAQSARCAQIEPELMPDALHPNAEGMELFAKCIAPVLDARFAASSGDGLGGLWKLGG